MRDVVVASLTAAAATTAALSFIGTESAFAAAPVRVGWWSAAAANGVVVPAPTAPSGGIRVQAGGGDTLAFGAVLFGQRLRAGTLRLTIATATGSPAVQACPASNDSWVDGDNQPMSSAPAYDCTVAKFAGRVAADGKTVSFPVSPFGQTVDGQLDLVIVPAVDPASPVPMTFSVDLAAPDAHALLVTVPAPGPPPSRHTGGRPGRGPGDGAGSLPQAEPTATITNRTVLPAGSVTPQPPQAVSPVIAPAATEHAQPVARLAALDIAPNKKGLALAAFLLAVASWIRFFPNERS